MGHRLSHPCTEPEEQPEGTKAWFDPADGTADTSHPAAVGACAAGSGGGFAAAAAVEHGASAGASLAGPLEVMSLVDEAVVASLPEDMQARVRALQRELLQVRVRVR